MKGRPLYLIGALALLAVRDDRAVEAMSTGIVPGQDRATAALLCPSSLTSCDPAGAAFVAGIPDEMRYTVVRWQGDGPACSSVPAGWTCGPKSLHVHNGDANAPPGAYRGRPVMIPLGVTGVRVRLASVRQWYSVSSQPLQLALVNWDGSAVTGGTANCAPTATATDCATGSITVAPGAEYGVRVLVNSVSGQATFLAGKLTVEPTSSTVGFWASKFSRLDADGVLFGINSLPGSWSNPRRPDALSYSEMRFVTNATTFFVEAFANVHDSTSSGGALDTRDAFYVDTGSGTTSIVPEIQGGLNGASLALSERRVVYSAVTNPVVGGAPSAVILRSGLHEFAAWPTLAPEDRGVYLDAVYVPQSAQLVVSIPPRPVIAGITDSKGVAYPTGPNTSLPALLRARGYDVTWQGLGGDAIGSHMTANTVAAAWPMVRGLALMPRPPVTVLMQLQRNDWANGGYSYTTLAGYLSTIYDAGHSAAPAARWLFPQIAKEGTESTSTTVGNVAWDTMRANNKASVCASTSSIDSTTRANACSIPQTDGLWTSPECATTTCVTPINCASPTYDSYCGCGTSRCAADTVHLADAGLERYERLISGEGYPVPTVLLGASAWYEADVGVSGGAMGTATTTGTCGSVSFSGTSTRSFALAAEVASTAGGLGYLRLSYDGGRSWPPSEQFPTFSTGSGGTVALPIGSGLSSTGISVVFGASGWANTCTFSAAPLGGAWAPIVGSATLGLYSAGSAVTWQPSTAAFNNAATNYLPCKAGAHCFKSPTTSIAPPFWIGITAAIDSATTQYVYFGRQSGKTGLALFINTSTTVRLTDGTSNLDTTVATPTSPHCVVIGYTGTTATSYLDGVQAATGAMGGGVTEQDYFLGYDAVYGITGNPTVAAFEMGTGALTADQARGICARSAFKYGTP